MPRKNEPFNPRCRRKPRELGYLLTPNQITELAMVPHMALEKLQMGIFGADDWNAYGCFANTVQLLAQEAGHTDVVAMGTATNLALHTMRQRAERLGKWGCSGPELTALRSAINPMDAFLRTRTTTQVRRALERLDKAMQAMTEQNVGPLEVAA